VTPVYELAMPIEFTSFFLNDEKALSVHPTLSEAPARTTYYVSKWMPFLEGGEYLIRCVAEDASLWLSTQERDNSRSIYFTKRDSGPQEATIFLPRGRQRFDIVLTNVSDVANPASRCFLAFSLWKTGKLIYSSAGKQGEFARYRRIGPGDTGNGDVDRLDAPQVMAGVIEIENCFWQIDETSAFLLEGN
jgi:hypothetical protein